MIENDAGGAATAPVNSSIHMSGKLSPDRHAKPKKGRKPTSQSGCTDSFILRCISSDEVRAGLSGEAGRTPEISFRCIDNAPGPVSPAEYHTRNHRSDEEQ